MRKILLIAFVLILLTQNTTYAQNLDLGVPRSVSVSQIESDPNTFRVKWRNEAATNILLSDPKIEKDFFYQVDIYMREGVKITTKNLSYRHSSMTVGEDGYYQLELNPIQLNYTSQNVDIMNNTYSFRIRNGLNMTDILGSYFIKGSYSTPVNIGLVYPYNYASQWAIVELDKSVEYNLLTEDMKGNMRDVVTREEFSEVIIRFIESKTGEEVSITSSNPFSDTDDPYVLKAASLGIIKGYVDGTFKPNNPIFRQDIGVMITRSLKTIYPNLDMSFVSIDNSELINAYAYDSMMFLNNKGILKGDEKGNLNPLSNTTREEAAVLMVRTYEKFN